jgi:hypothetical protein
MDLEIRDSAGYDNWGYTPCATNASEYAIVLLSLLREGIISTVP